jgi:DNA-binding NarL/FixJ family response regulator
VPVGAQRDEGHGEGLSTGEKELLLLLAKGLTDEAAAKRLGVSLRTARRQMAALMERLGATSRFEAGLKAAQRGWL